MHKGRPNAQVVVNDLRLQQTEPATSMPFDDAANYRSPRPWGIGCFSEGTDHIRQAPLADQSAVRSDRAKYRLSREQISTWGGEERIVDKVLKAVLTDRIAIAILVPVLDLGVDELTNLVFFLLFCGLDGHRPDHPGLSHRLS